LPDSVFQRDGKNIYVYVPITMSQALLGDYVPVPTLTGEVQVHVSPGTQSGETQVLRGRGIQCVNDPSIVGNQYIHFEVKFPKTLTKKQLKAIQEFKKGEVPPPRPSSSSSATLWRKSYSLSSSSEKSWFNRVRSFMKMKIFDT